MKYVIGGVLGYFFLLWIADKQANAAMAACGGVGSPNMIGPAGTHPNSTHPNCPGYDTAIHNWSWLPRLNMGL